MLKLVATGDMLKLVATGDLFFKPLESAVFESAVFESAVKVQTKNRVNKNALR